MYSCFDIYTNSLLFQIDFVPAFVKTYSTELLLYVAEAGMEIFSLPISAKSDVPAITLETPYLDYGRCFLQYPYTLNVTFVNPSYLPVKYEMQPPSDKRILHYSTDPSRGIIEPRSTLNLPLQIETQVLGEIVSPIVFNILGSLEDPLEVTVRCVGEGPVINVSSTELHWGRQPVLTPLPKTVYLSNESLIQAEFECALVSCPNSHTTHSGHSICPKCRAGSNASHEQQVYAELARLEDVCTCTNAFNRTFL